MVVSDLIGEVEPVDRLAIEPCGGKPRGLDFLPQISASSYDGSVFAVIPVT